MAFPQHNLLKQSFYDNHHYTITIFSLAIRIVTLYASLPYAVVLNDVLSDFFPHPFVVAFILLAKLV